MLEHKMEVSKECDCVSIFNSSCSYFKTGIKQGSRVYTRDSTADEVNDKGKPRLACEMYQNS